MSSRLRRFHPADALYCTRRLPIDQCRGEQAMWCVIATDSCCSSACSAATTISARIKIVGRRNAAEPEISVLPAGHPSGQQRCSGVGRRQVKRERFGAAGRLWITVVMGWRS